MTIEEAMIIGGRKMTNEEMINALKEFCSKRNCFNGNHTGDIKKCQLYDTRLCTFELLDDAKLKQSFEMAFNNKPDSVTVTIPADATNGDVLCMLFPNMHYTLSEKTPRVVTTIGIASTFDIDWWNAPYKEESERA